MTDRGEIVTCHTEDGETRLDVRMENDSVWLTQVQVAQLVGTEVLPFPGISAIFSEAGNWKGKRLFPKWKWSGRREDVP